MGEYVKYKGQEVKIGTCESLYYVSYPRFKEAFEQGLLAPSEFSVPPAKCLEVDSGFLFRFPFPDEDRLSFGEIGNHDFDRGLPIRIKPGDDKVLQAFTEAPRGQEFKIELVQQKFVRREGDGASVMAAVFKDSASGKMFRIEEPSDILKIALQIIERYVLNLSDRKVCMLYSQIATRMLAGYRLEPGMALKDSLINNTKLVKKSKGISNDMGL